MSTVNEDNGHLLSPAKVVLQQYYCAMINRNIENWDLPFDIRIILMFYDLPFQYDDVAYCCSFSIDMEPCSIGNITILKG